MDPRLQDQENSGQAEAEMMRQELETVRTRYDDDQQREVMDETPPRIGRFERHM
jgi:GTP cyclohydrolase I